MSPSTSRNQRLFSVVLSSLLLLLAVLILFISLVRATLSQVRGSLTPTSYKNTLLTLNIAQINASDAPSDEQVVNYNLPSPGILPTNPFYGFKRIRDYFWILFTRESIARGKLELMMADKKLSEANALIPDGKVRHGYESLDDSLRYLDESYTSVKSAVDKPEERNQLLLQIRNAGIAYEQIINNMGSSVTNPEEDKKDIMLEKIRTWNDARAAETEQE